MLFCIVLVAVGVELKLLDKLVVVCGKSEPVDVAVLFVADKLLPKDIG